MQYTFLAIFHLFLLKLHEVSAMIISTLQLRKLTLGRLGNLLQITQLLRDRVGFGVLSDSRGHSVALGTDTPWAEGISMRLGVSWVSNPYSLLTICISSGKLLYLSESSFHFFLHKTGTSISDCYDYFKDC